ncbi:MAG: tRNA-uridine aminocarboxypropyltransferase [Pseudomonadota bacterium]
MSRRDNGQHRCRQCAMHLSLCICAEVPSLTTASKLCLVMHRDELLKTTNTGRLAARCLQGSEILVHGRVGERVAAPAQIGGRSLRELLLFPCAQAEPLGPQHAESGPVRLVVPDGTWRQATKMTRRLEWMAALPRVTLAAGALTRYRLRSEPKEGGLSTIEAIARAFAVLEGTWVEEKLQDVFRKMTDRTLYSRGLLARQHVFGGVPSDAQSQDPNRVSVRGGWGCRDDRSGTSL